MPRIGKGVLELLQHLIQLRHCLKRKNSRIATTDLEYGASLNDNGEYADNFKVNISSIFGQNLTKEVYYFHKQSIPGLFFAGILLAKNQPGVKAKAH